MTLMFVRDLPLGTAGTLALLLLAGTACGDAGGPPPEPPSIIAARLDEPEPLIRNLSIELSEPAGVQVDYWTDAAPRLRVTDASVVAEHSVFLPGLRAGAVYEYEIRPLEVGRTRATPVYGQLTTDTLPSDLASLRFVSLGSPSFRLMMLELRGEPFSGYVIVDNNGAVVWYRRGLPESFTRRANGDYVLLDSGVGLSEIRPDLTVVHELPETSMHMHHDIVATPANTVLFIAQDPRTFEGETWTGEGIWEWDPETGSVAQRWSAWDFMSPETDLGPKSISTDWLHANSLAIGPRGNVLVSFPSINQVISIGADFQSLEWRLGGPNATLKLDPDDQFWFEHTATEIAPGHVLVFDNGRDRPGGLFSRALELTLDLQKGTASKAWEFRPRPEIYAPIIGSARRLPNGNTVVNFGIAAGVVGASGPVAVYEVNSSGSVGWILRVEGLQLGNYRATPLGDIGGEVVVPG